MLIENGLLTTAKQLASPNYDNRPQSVNPDLLVLHSISLPPGKYGGKGIEQLFSNQLNPDEHPYYQQIADLKVSAHLLIRRTGELLQFVNFDARAWHAGQSCFEGRECCNDYSIGIELEGTDTDNFEEAQYQALLAVTLALLKYYPDMAAKRITGHEDIASGRKTDPGKGFDWVCFRSMLSAAHVDQNLTTNIN